MRAAERVRDDDKVEETQSLAEAEGEKWRRRRENDRPDKATQTPCTSQSTFPLPPGTADSDVQPCRLPPSLAKGLHWGRIGCS